MSSIRETKIKTLNCLLIHSFIYMYNGPSNEHGGNVMEEATVRSKGAPGERAVSPVVAGAVLM
jgi:hypothetical protein